MERKYDLDERCITFGAAVVKLTDNLPNTRSAGHLGMQLLRSGTAPALRYGEVQSAESRKDFIHKMSIALKELRESRNNLRIQLRAGLMDLKLPDHEWLLKECEELIAILNTSIRTAQRNASTK